jgi:RNA polymerase sigma factor (sigma-70 family)
MGRTSGLTMARRTAAYIDASDAELARAMRPEAQDDAAWAEFWHRLAGDIMAFIQAKAGVLSQDVCDDIFSQTVCKIQSAVERFDIGQGSFRSWCLKIAENTFIDTVRRRGMRPAPADFVSFGEIEERYSRDDDDLPEALRVSTSGDDAELGGSEAMIHEAFESLNPIDQAVIELRIIRNLPDREVAQVTGKPESQIRMIKYKALQKLKRAFERLLSIRRAK